MVFSLPEGLAPEVYPLAWLVGRWRGHGVVAYPNVPETAMTQDVVVDHDGGPYLRWTSTIRLDAAAEVPAIHEAPDPAATAVAGDDDGTVWATESGFWRVPPVRPDGLPQDRHPVELLLVDPAGYLTLYAGAVGNGRIDLVHDLLARTPDAAEVTASRRLYGLVGGELMWTWDLAAFGEPLQSYASARLVRQP